MISGTYRRWNSDGFVWYNINNSMLNVSLHNHYINFKEDVSENVIMFLMDVSGSVLVDEMCVPEELREYVNSEFFEIDLERFRQRNIFVK